MLRLRFERRGAGTALTRCRYTLPLQATTPLAMEDGAAYLMLLNPTGGVMGGDRLVTEIAQGPETHVCLTTPSATRVYRAGDLPAEQVISIQLGEGATVEYVPNHLLPHAGAALLQSLRVEMASGSRAILCDGLAAGRIAHGERWSFKEVDSRMEVLGGGEPLFFSRSIITPGLRDPRNLGMMGRFNYTGSVAAFADGFQRWEDVAGALAGALDGLPDVPGGVSVLARGGCFARFLAGTAFALARAIETLWTLARKLVLGREPFDMRKY